MQRHPDNPNLYLLNTPYWKGLPLSEGTGTYVREYVDRVIEVLADANVRYARLCVVRFDLHFPQVLERPDPGAISRFFHRLQREIDNDLGSRSRRHDCQIAYVWAAERHRSTMQHYHVTLFLNKDAYYSLGRYPSIGFDFNFAPDAGSGLAHCIVRAWAHALRIRPSEILGCVYFARNGVYHLDRNSSAWGTQVRAAWLRVKYLAKARTKEYGAGYRCFGSSRTPYRPEAELMGLLPVPEGAYGESLVESAW